ncbi:MAG: peptidoglycan DD-metalloendopeptidase family protein [Candidatus Uhrbacteria bacterium]
MKQKLIQLVIISGLILPLGSMQFVFAEDDSAEKIDALNEVIEEKQVHLDQVNRRIDAYKDEINKKQAEELSLSNEVSLLENRIAKTELDIEATQIDIDTVQLELNVIEEQILQLESQLENQRDILASILRRINQYDENTILELVFGTESFSELFDQLRYLEEINQDLEGALQDTKIMKGQLEEQQSSKEDNLVRLIDLEQDLEQEQLLLENEIGSKEVLIAEVQYSEAQFAELLYELSQEEQYIETQIGQLQREIEQKIVETDEYGDATILTWPLDPNYRGISATFHDPTYPFRHLFEHSGIDIPAMQGSPIVAPAPGYVAWVKQGRLYGNYVMIIHTNGIATLYAHLSKPLVQADQFISRGETIALSGGMPGTSGAGMSTGPHLHFEVRLNGIPVDPMNYLVGY